MAANRCDVYRLEGDQGRAKPSSMFKLLKQLLVLASLSDPLFAETNGFGFPKQTQAEPNRLGSGRQAGRKVAVPRAFL